MRAVLEGVAFGLRDSLDLLRDLGVEVTSARVSGGGARSQLWLEICAAVLGLPIERTVVEEGSAFGAALLGGVAGGVFADVHEAVEATVRTQRGRRTQRGLAGRLRGAAAEVSRALSGTSPRRRRYGRAVKAVLIERPNEVALVELETPPPDPGEVLVRSHVAGVCRTDLEMLHGGLTDPRWVRFPLVPGHEWSGTVAELGEGVTDLAVGERVVCEGMIPCNRCRRCKEGNTQLCLNYDQIGFTRQGGYGEFVRVPRHVVHRLPDSVSFAAGVLVEPASCVLRGLERGRPRPGDTIGVIGVGTLGSLALMLARLYSPGPWSPTASARRSSTSRAPRRRRDRARRRARCCRGDSRAARCRARSRDRDRRRGGRGRSRDPARASRGRVVLLGIAGEGKMLELPADRDHVRRHGRRRELLVPDVGMVECRPTTRARAPRPRPDRHASLSSRPLRGGIRAHGQPPRPRREGRSRAPERLARRPVLTFRHTITIKLDTRTQRC